MEKDLDTLKIDYDHTVQYIFHLSDIRFKLLGLLPVATGIAFSFTDIDTAPINSLIVGILGLLVSIGVLFYDQRNSEIYDSLISRARALERKMGLVQSKPSETLGGTFTNRPTRGRKLFGFVLMWHDRGLALIYAAVIWVWLFIVIASSITLLGIDYGWLYWGLIGFSMVMALILYLNLIYLNKGPKRGNDQEVEQREAKSMEP